LVLRRGLRRCVVALGVGGELEEEVLEARAVRGSQLDEGDPGLAIVPICTASASLRNPSPDGTTWTPPRSRASRSASCSTAFTNAPRACSSSCLVPWATIRPCPMRISSSAIFSTS
jgi:hypothetical protein